MLLVINFNKSHMAVWEERLCMFFGCAENNSCASFLDNLGHLEGTGSDRITLKSVLDAARMSQEWKRE
jgi:hypothetical protein